MINRNGEIKLIIDPVKYLYPSILNILKILNGLYIYAYIYLMSIRSIKAAGKGTESQERSSEEKRRATGLETRLESRN